MVIGADNTAQERRITIGVRQGENVEIATGLQEGEKVVVAGGLGLENKAKVKIIEAPAAEADEDDK
jgi:multidrug efflux pump subunit AcrA (membrane-fusion protein)